MINKELQYLHTRQIKKFAAITHSFVENNELYYKEEMMKLLHILVIHNVMKKVKLTIHTSFKRERENSILSDFYII